MVTIVNNDNGVKTIPSTPDNESCDARDTVDQYVAFEAESFYNNLNQSLLCPLSQTGGRWKIQISCDKEIPIRPSLPLGVRFLDKGHSKHYTPQQMPNMVSHLSNESA